MTLKSLRAELKAINAALTLSLVNTEPGELPEYRLTIDSLTSVERAAVVAWMRGHKLAPYTTDTVGSRWDWKRILWLLPSREVQNPERLMHLI
jgi:hypothetical protein